MEAQEDANEECRRWRLIFKDSAPAKPDASGRRHMAAEFTGIALPVLKV